MSHRPLPLSLLCVVVSLLALGVVGVVEAIIIYDFPIFGLVNGAQIARVNAVLQSPSDPDQPCPVNLTFLDNQGNQIGDPNTFQLRGGTAAAADFIGDPGLRVGQRLAIRVQVSIGDPGIFPGCADGVLTSVEVVDQLTRATHFILTNPVTREVAR
jgi:hypothetical protein